MQPAGRYMKHPTLKGMLVLAAVAVASGCTMKSQEAPPLAGPSEFGQSVSVAVSPDSIPQDGASQSLVTVTVRDADSQPMRNVTLRIEMRVNGTPVDFGSISARSIVTGADGRATVVYTAPAAPAVTVDEFTIVDIGATPIGTDFNNAVLRSAAIRLTPPGIVVPPLDLTPAFTMTPTAPQDNQTVLFDASASRGAIVEYQWDFGDGARSSGRTTSHAFATPGTYVVRLTILDGVGRSASTSQSITVGGGTLPTAVFVFSPTNPLPAQQVFFNASGSRAAPGRTLTSFRWDFGDGTSGTGVQPAAKVYAAPGQYTVTLTVTDDVGRTAAVSQTITIGSDSPTAAFTFAPESPIVGNSVAFNGSSSTAVTGRTIVSYTWNFGDGGSGSGAATTHTFTTAGTFNVTLTVVDSEGKSGSVTRAVTVRP
jgi:PKD repeat protein